MIFFALAGCCCPGISKITVFSQFYICFVFDFAWFSVMFNDNLIALISFGFLWIRGLFLTRFLYFYWFLVNLFGNGFLWDYLDVFAFLKLFKHFLYVFFTCCSLFFTCYLFFLHVIFFLLHVFIPPQKGNRKGRHFFYTYSQKGRATRKNTCTSIRGAKKDLYMFSYRLRRSCRSSLNRNLLSKFICLHTGSVAMRPGPVAKIHVFILPPWAWAWGRPAI